uniref:Thioesterase domain-containing protein n=1 Tax=Davidia involucrata TaxID=16924 RepID=A0A5B7AD14_DAVIN
MGKEKPSAGTVSSATPTSATITRDVTSQTVSIVTGFLDRMGMSQHIPQNCDTKDFYSDLIRGSIKVNTVQRGRISCLLSVKPALTNAYGGLHGGAVAAVAEIISIACARTVVDEGKELFLGELSISYLSAAPRNAELMVDGSVIRSGRNLTVIAVEFKLKESTRLTYTCRATFYNMPVASL